MKSMTGFADGRYDFDSFSFYVSYKSFNHRFLDISFRGTGITPVSENMIRSVIKDKICRGKVEVVFDLYNLDRQKWDIHLNESLLTDVIDRLASWEKRRGQDIQFSLEPFLKIPMIFHIESLFNQIDKKQEKEIKKAVEKVFDLFIKSRIKEGADIQKDLLKRMAIIDSYLAVLAQGADEIEKANFEKYKERLGRLLNGIRIDENRLMQEAAILTEKMCVAEEITRLQTHGKRLKQLILSKDIDMKGKESDFILQEMQRETYTIASKVNENQMLENVILVRREVEKIRQQIQNIE